MNQPRNPPPPSRHSKPEPPEFALARELGRLIGRYLALPPEARGRRPHCSADQVIDTPMIRGQEHTGGKMDAVPHDQTDRQIQDPPRKNL